MPRSSYKVMNTWSTTTLKSTSVYSFSSFLGTSPSQSIFCGGTPRRPVPDFHKVPEGVLTSQRRQKRSEPCGPDPAQRVTNCLPRNRKPGGFLATTHAGDDCMKS